MAKTLSKSGIVTGADILASHVTQSVDAFTGIDAYDITVSGSVTVSGSLLLEGTTDSGQAFVLTYDTSSGQVYYTASSAIGGGGGGTFDTSSLLTTASAEFSETTFTKGDGSTFQVDTTPRQVIETVKNLESFTLPKGTPVYASGSTGNAIHVYAASSSRSDRMPAAYVLNNNLTSGQEGIGILTGFINGVNTSAFASGDVVYVGAEGGYTNVKPTGSNLIQNLGKVTISAVNGSGVISGAGRANDVPNITEGYVWVGNSDSVATPTATSSIQNVVSSSYATTASYVLEAAVPTLQQVTDEGSTTTQPITSSAFRINNGTNISPDTDGSGQLQVNGNAYTGYIAMDGTAMYLGHNSVSRNFVLQTNETDRITIGGSGNVTIKNALFLPDAVENFTAGSLSFKASQTGFRYASIARAGSSSGDISANDLIIRTSNGANNFIFKQSGGLTITGSANLFVRGPITGSTALISGSGGAIIESSGSTVFEVIGSEGTLFSIDDDLDGVIFTANDRSGLPVLEASASGEVYIGKAPQSLYTTAVISSTTAATTQSIFGLSTSSYGGAFFDYTVQSGSNARAGSIMSVWNGSNISFTETTTTDIGDTTDFNVIVHISQSQAQIASHATRAGYNIKTIIRSI